MTFAFPKSEISDIPLIQQIGRDSYEPYYRHIWHPGGIDWYMDRCFNEELLRAELSDDNNEFILPRDPENRPVGLLKLGLQTPVPGTTHENALYLEKIYLLPPFFGKGVGQILIEHVVQKARSLGRGAVWLMVLKNGPVSAYERAGFEKIREMSWEFDLLKKEERGGWLMIRNLAG